MPAVSNNLEVYLNQWVKIASGDRVVLARGIALSSYTGNSGYLVFKCTKCGDNWHVGVENFHGNIADPAAGIIPSVLSDWVKKHRHVCKKYINSKLVSGGPCANCKWPYGAHEESWSKDVKHSPEGTIPGVKWVYPIVEPVDGKETAMNLTGSNTTVVTNGISDPLDPLTIDLVYAKLLSMSDGPCANCKWPYGAHEESWSKDVKHSPEGTIPGVKWVYPIVEPVEVVKSVKIAEQPTGRMFREK